MESSSHWQGTQSGHNLSLAADEVESKAPILDKGGDHFVVPHFPIRIINAGAFLYLPSLLARLAVVGAIFPIEEGERGK